MVSFWECYLTAVPSDAISTLHPRTAPARRQIVVSLSYLLSRFFDICLEMLNCTASCPLGLFDTQLPPFPLFFLFPFFFSFFLDSTAPTVTSMNGTRFSKICCTKNKQVRSSAVTACCAFCFSALQHSKTSFYKTSAFYQSSSLNEAFVLSSLVSALYLSLNSAITGLDSPLFMIARRVRHMPRLCTAPCPPATCASPQTFDNAR